MTTHSDWMARDHEGLYNQANQTVNYLTDAVLARIGIIVGPALTWYQTEFISKHTLFNNAFEAWLNPAERTPLKTASLVDTETIFRPSYRQLYTGYLRNNPLVTDEDLVGCGLPKRPSGGSTPAPDPKGLVEATTDTSIPATVILHYREKGSTGTAKPKGVHGAEIIWEILDAPPTDWEQLTHSTFDTRTPAELVFHGEQRGKTLYFALRWENTRGVKGPWNDIQNVIIP